MIPAHELLAVERRSAGNGDKTGIGRMMVGADRFAIGIGRNPGWYSLME